jgi:hypothetical protein
VSAFEYVFAFYSLVLGLAAAEVVSGFAEMWRDRRRMEIGIATPLMALCVLLAVMNAWISFWARRETMEVGAYGMVLTILTALPYVFVSRMMFPRVGEGTSLEDHFFEHRRLMLLGLIAPVIVGRGLPFLVEGVYPTGFAGAYFAARVALPAALLFTASRRITQAGLAAVALVLTVGLFR